MDDAALLVAWRAGDATAGRALVERHYPAVERFFVRKTSPVVAADLIQTTFLKLTESRERIDEARGVRPFLFGIARNVLLMYFRGHRSDAAKPDVATRSLADLAPTATQILAGAQESRLLYRALCAIPLESQILLEMYYWEGMRGPELARVFDIPLGTVRSRLRKARRLLDAQLEALADSPALLHSTVSNLEDWARRLREVAPGSGG